MTLAELNAASSEQAAESLGQCCGVRGWVSAMVAARPFRSLALLLATADHAWRQLGPDDWREIFAHHPRIGELTNGHHATARASASEQSRVAQADVLTREALAQVNRDYERRFGHIFLTCATGKSAEAMLAEARLRLVNQPEAELAVAAEEQRKIMQLRLRRLFTFEEAARA
jgi:OHCU decarboxylase